MRERRALAARHRPPTRRWPRDLVGALRQRRTLYVLAAVLLALVIAVPVFAPGQAVPPAEAPTPEATPAASTRKTYGEPPPMALAPGTQYSATLQTSRGRMRAELYADQAPEAVNNFFFLARERFYDNGVIHKVEPGQRIELGAPNPDGSGNPGYTVPVTTAPREPRIGSLVVVDQGGGSMGSQFAIVMADNPPPGSLVFGRITEGLDIARELQPGDPLQSIQVVEVEPRPERPERPQRPERPERPERQASPTG